MSSFSFRLPSSTLSPSRKTMQRKPSHLGSYTKPPGTESGAGTLATGFASIGFIGGEMGKAMELLHIRSEVM